MQIYTFAHKNEAAAFFHYHPFQECTHFSDLYFDGNNYLLITGEGLWDSLTKCILAINYLAGQNITIKQIFNLGVAGSLRPHLKKFSVYSIRTSYAALNLSEPEFHSYSSKHQSSFPKLDMIDCLSFYKRNTSSKEKEVIAPFAALIDRELWAIAKAAQSFHLPWESLKVISDEIQDENTCQLIQQIAHEFSSKIYSEFQHKIEQQQHEVQQNNFEVFLTLLQKKSFHLTFSQKNLTADYLNRILIQENISLEHFIHEIPFENWDNHRAKENTHSLIRWMKIRLTPQLGLYATKISQWLKIWQNSNLNLQIHVSEDLESLDIKFKSYNLHDWHKIITHLQKIPRHELENILTGHS